MRLFWSCYDRNADEEAPPTHVNEQFGKDLLNDWKNEGTKIANLTTREYNFNNYERKPKVTNTGLCRKTVGTKPKGKQIREDA